MTPKMMNELREILRDKEAGLLADFQRAREQLNVELITDKSAGDTMDDAGISADYDLAARQININRALLGHVRTALEAMEEGVYGRCLSCDCQIPAKRLLASPWVPYCVDCQQRIEQGSDSNGYQPAEILPAPQRARPAS